MQKEKDTAFVLNELNNATTLSSGLNMINNDTIEFKNLSFSDFFNNYISEHQELKLANIIKDSGLSRQYAYDIINGKRAGSRDRIIALCFAAGMDLNVTNHALKNAKHHELYAKDKRDAIIILAINSKRNGSHDYVTATDLSILLDEQNQEPLNISTNI